MACVALDMEWPRTLHQEAPPASPHLSTCLSAPVTPAPCSSHTEPFNLVSNRIPPIFSTRITSFRKSFAHKQERTNHSLHCTPPCIAIYHSVLLQNAWNSKFQSTVYMSCPVKSGSGAHSQFSSSEWVYHNAWYPGGGGRQGTKI